MWVSSISPSNFSLIGNLLSDRNHWKLADTHTETESTLYPIWGEYQIQSVCACVCVSVCPAIPAQIWWRDKGYPHLNPSKKFIMIAFTIKTQKRINGANIEMGTMETIQYFKCSKYRTLISVYLS